MNFELFGVRVTVSYPFLAVLTVFLTLDKTGLAGQMLAAALMHELGHLTVMYVLRQPPRRIDCASFGIRIVKQSSSISYGKEAAIYAAGPLVNLACAAACAAGEGGISTLGQVHLLLGLFHLLPVGALDGGMLVSALAHWAGGPRAARVTELVLAALILLPILCGAVLLALRGQGNITLIVTLFYLAATVFLRRK